MLGLGGLYRRLKFGMTIVAEGSEIRKVVVLARFVTGFNVVDSKNLGPPASGTAITVVVVDCLYNRLGNSLKSAHS